MANKRVSIRRRRRSSTPEENTDQEPVNQLADESDEEIAARVKAEAKAVEEATAEEEQEDAEEPKPVTRRRRTARTLENNNDEPEEPVARKMAESVPLEDLLAALREGEVATLTMSGGHLVVRLLPDSEHVLDTKAGQQMAKRRQGLTGKAYDLEVQTEEYTNHYNTWKELSYEEKVKEAKKLGVKWEKHESEKIDNMRLTAAVREHLGIEKYKPQYQTAAARKALREG